MRQVKLRNSNKVMIIFVLPALIFLMAFKLIPAILGLWYALTNWNGINPSYEFVALDNFIEILTKDHYFWSAMKFTTKYVVVTVIVQNLVALILAVSIENLKKGKGIFRTIFYMPNMISMIIGGYMWSFIFTQVLYYIADHSALNFLDQSWLGDPKFSFIAIIIVAAWGGVGYLMVIYIAAIQGVPKVLLEAATIDGATPTQCFRYIVIPKIMHAFTICLFITLNSAYQVFDVIYTLTGGGPGRATQVVALNIFEEAFGRSNRFGYATAKSTILFAVILIITLTQLLVMKNKEEES